MKKFLLLVGVGAIMTSCAVSHTVTVTNNSVGSKVGVVKGTPFKKDLDLSYEAAAKAGGITKIATAEFKVKYILIFPKYEVVVTGE